ncbi:MAG: hypothetical protein HY308_09080 [Gammaproteobacteria bacterium]|nr:hypothetical protein [Gammaproteobacteria bacterium]
MTCPNIGLRNTSGDYRALRYGSFRSLLAVAAVTLMVVGCGGGGGDSNESSPDPNTPPIADTASPSTPSNLAASAGSANQINLSWTGSTDDIGVSGYRLERCQGASCTNFTQVATPSGANHSDTGLSASTMYRYRLRAADAAGNLSEYSAVASATTSAAGSLAIGTLIHDGPATPEQVSLFLPVTGSLPKTAVANVRYKPTSASAWISGHPLYRIRPDLSETPPSGTVPDAFAWPIIDLQPSTSYDVEVTVTSDGVSDVRTGTFMTRTLPAAAGTPNKTIAAGASSANLQTAFNNLNPGDVLEIKNGTYTVSGLQLNRSGTATNPIYLRGESRNGVILSANSGRVLQVLAANYVIIENMTFQGSGVDSGTAASSTGIQFWDGAPSQTQVTVRNLTMNGVDIAIKSYAPLSQFMAYDNTFNGNNTWTAPLITTNATWNDDGICIPGFGNVAFNNTLKGFGDTFAYTVSGAQTIGVHFYRNEVRNSGDDLLEADYAMRNLTLYDNRSHNSATFLSLDPLYGGPLLAARNIAINTQRSPGKFNSTDSGHFLYNNTIVRTNGSGAHVGWGWVQFNNGSQKSWGFRNNVFVYRGSGKLFGFEPGGNDPIDFTHNSWFPDGAIWWTSSGGSFATLAQTYSGLPATSPVFGTATKRHEQDNITVSNPWTDTVTLGADYLTEITATYTPTPAAGTSIKNTGAPIANITDGYSGNAPDRGAIIAGRSAPRYGDRSAGGGATP